jgi:hypothetical protein
MQTKLLAIINVDFDLIHQRLIKVHPEDTGEKLGV